jgi:tetratricopeptide (TPR) repeat protein
MNFRFTKVLIFAVVMTLVAGACWTGRKVYRKSMERHLVAEAQQYVEKHDWRNATLCLQRVIQINPFSTDGCRLVSDLLETQGSPAALSWRIRLAKLQPDHVTNRLAWAETALKLTDFKSAGTALDGLDAATKQTAAYYKLAGALAWGLHQPAQAEVDYSRALELEPTNQTVALNLDTVRLVSTNANVAKAARVSLEQIASNPTLRLVALRYLTLDAVNRHAPEQAVAYSLEIVQDPSASFDDKLKHLELLRTVKSNEYSAAYNALKKSAEASPTYAYLLGNWIIKFDGPETALSWLHSLPQHVQTNQPVPLVIVDCEIELKRWTELSESLDQQSWGNIDFYRLAVESLALRSLRETTAAQNDWDKSLLLASRDPRRLTRLAQAAGLWGWIPERTKVLQEIVDESPLDKWAVEQLSLQWYADGDTAKLQELFVKSQLADPLDVHVKNNLASVLMLRKSDLDKAYRLAKEAYETSSDDPFIVSTYAYSLMLQGKPDEALKLVNGVKPEYLQIPSIAVYYGVIQAESGHKDLARPFLARANQGKLLPEELKMVRLAQASL